MAYLRVQNISKAYKRYAKKWGRAKEWIGLGQQHELRWVLRDVSFNVEPGDAVGIIGINGAGKSTLLKIITGTTRPTTGNVEAGGRISALLELGLGFHMEFTGRENAFMAAQLQGLSNDEIAGRMAEIEAFAEIGDYFDQPVRTYSSGMHVRLAFSVATAVRPDILIVDEALSVGDTYFQHKSFDRIRKFRDQGTTLLFVSHNPGAIKSLCNRAILLDGGIAVRDGEPDTVLDYYNAVVARQQADNEIQQAELIAGKKMTRSGNGQVAIESVELMENNITVRAVRSGAQTVIQVRLVCQTQVDDLTVGILIRDRLGNDVFGTNTYHLNTSPGSLWPGERRCVDFVIDTLSLGPGSYSLSVALHRGDAHTAGNYDWWDMAVVFQVVPGSHPRGVGVCTLPIVALWHPNSG
jgi:lipopolysaccharide transport system ATP-binding protein